MCEIRINFNQVEKAIAVMRAAQIRRDGYDKAGHRGIRAECRNRGVRYIRLDTGLEEKTVRKIYLSAGYKIVDILDYPNGRSMALYELEV